MLKNYRINVSFITLLLMIYCQTSQANLYYVHGDHLGTPQILTDENQTVVWEVTRKPFGEVIPLVNQVDYQQGFPGQFADTNTPYIYNYYRDYDPELGRYIQSDPIGLGGGVNTYAYVGGNPVLLIDPYGEAGLPGAIYGAVSGGVGGYITGGRQGAVYGAFAGALVGLVNITASHWAGAAFGGALASYIGQGAGNYFSGKDIADVNNYNHCAAAGAALGGILGGAASGPVSRFVPPIRFSIIGRSLSAPGISNIPGAVTGSIVEGVIVGGGELIGQDYIDQYLD